MPRDKPILEAGVFLIDKPAGPTSFRMVQFVRRALRIKKVGHAGTLDPFATGLLIICAGRPATRKISCLMAGDKEYLATLRLGIETDTHDVEGTVTGRHAVPDMDRATVEQCLAGFVGEQLQAPPRYSAVKHKGKPLYAYARKGIVITKEPRPVTIHRIVVVDFDTARCELVIRVACGKGTYIRALAADIGRKLGCGAHLVALRRLQSGPFLVQDALDGSQLADPEQGRELLLQHCLSVEGVAERLSAGAFPLKTII